MLDIDQQQILIRLEDTLKFKKNKKIEIAKMTIPILKLCGFLLNSSEGNISERGKIFAYIVFILVKRKVYLV